MTQALVMRAQRDAYIEYAYVRNGERVPDPFHPTIAPTSLPFGSHGVAR